MVEIRSEVPGDREAIRDVVGRAFARPEVVDLVEAIRASDNYVPEFALVALSDGAVAGFVMESYAALVDGDVRHRVLTLSPLAVAPEFQRRGIGSALVETALARAEEQSEPLVTLEGDPGYYARFGFEHSVIYGVEIPLPDWAPSEAGQVRLLAAHDPSIRGRLEYPPAFGTLAAQ